jgi:hypothetical protein
MKKLLLSITAGAVFCAAIVSQAADKPSGYIDFGSFTNPKNGAQFVEVNLSSGMIGFAAMLAKGEAEVADVLRGLESIRVNVVGITPENREEIDQKLASIRETLEKNKWEKLVSAQEKNQDVGIFMKSGAGNSIEGLVVLVQDGTKEAVFVNIAGNINPEKLAVLGERFNIAPLKSFIPKQAKAKIPAN